WSSDVCSSDLGRDRYRHEVAGGIVGVDRDDVLPAGRVDVVDAEADVGHLVLEAAPGDTREADLDGRGRAGPGAGETRGRGGAERLAGRAVLAARGLDGEAGAAAGGGRADRDVEPARVLGEAAGD